MTDSYDIGDARDILVTFTDQNGVPADPTGITFKMREPDGTETTYVHGTDAEVVKESTGVYYVTWTYAKKGRHIARWNGTGVLISAEQDETWVRSGAI